jgi:hypothetical protein
VVISEELGILIPEIKEKKLIKTMIIS